MPTWSVLICGGAAAVAIFTVGRVIWAIIVRPSRTALKQLPGPPSPSLIFGNFKQVWSQDAGVVHEQWIEQYGNNVRFKGTFNRNQLLTLDLKAINHIMQRTDVYHKPPATREELGRVVGEGVIIAEGEKHKNQRRVLNPAFGPAQVRELTGIFLEKTLLLRDQWVTEVDKSLDRTAATTGDKLTGGTRIDVLSWLSKTTLDIIGLAGFSYPFNSLSASPHDTEDELNEAFSVMFHSANGFPLMNLAMRTMPFLRTIVKTERVRQISFAKRTMRRIGMQLLKEKKAAVLASLTHSINADKTTIAKDTVQGRDLLSLLVRANMAHDLPPSQRLSDEDVLAQIPTFMVAGHETTSTATTWALYALSLNPEAQDRLRAELQANPLPALPVGGALSQDEFVALNALPVLDSVVRETLRVHAPVPHTIRRTIQDDVIPLSEPFIGRDDIARDRIHISKGDTVSIPILLINRSKALWGEDAHEFKPERWLNPPKSITAIPGMWSNLLTFIGGPHSCIGYRFSLIETKILLHVLIASFKFELAVPKETIKGKTSIVFRPFVTTEMEKGNQMPLIVTPV